MEVPLQELVEGNVNVREFKDQAGGNATHVDSFAMLAYLQLRT